MIRVTIRSNGERKEVLMRSLIAAGNECDDFSRLVIRMERIF